MAKLQQKCKYCGKILKVESEKYYEPLGSYLRTYTCGHSDFIDKQQKIANLAEESEYTSLDGTKALYDFQEEGVKFLEDSNYSSGLFDAMGLGKTPQALVAARNAGFKRIIIIVPSAIIYQWAEEINTWLDDSALAVYPIIGGKTPIIPGFRCYIISRDTLARNSTWKKLVALNPDLIIVDECHSFNNSGSKRTGALVKLLKESACEHKILLSGTPIKNRAGEYFQALNILAPDKFFNRASFVRTWLAGEWNGRTTVYRRLRKVLIPRFQELVSPFILRREKEEVLKDLPPLKRNFIKIVVSDPTLRESYNRQVDLFANFLNTSERVNQMNLLGWLARFRHIVGIAKAQYSIDYIEEFLDSYENDKLAVGIHHQAARDLIYAQMQERGYNPLKLSGEDSAGGKANLQREFNENKKRRLMVIQILAGGEGLNLQSCANALIVEREWNSASEEQFESRFHRNGQTRKVIADYLIAHGTIDEWFHELVEEKRQILGETFGSWSPTSDTEFLKDLAHKTVSRKI